MKKRSESAYFMKIIHSIDEIPQGLQRPCVTVGNFDGVHLGHQKLFRAVRQCAHENGGVSVAVTFDPHPLQVLRPKGIKIICTIQRKIELITMVGIDVLIIIPFDQRFAVTTAEQFVQEILVNRIGVRDLFVGYDYAFGKGRAGNIEFLQKKGEKLDFSVTVISPFYKNDILVSSTKIRELVMAGAMEETAALLGRYYQIRGVVEHGKQRGGAEIGFPTANLYITEEDLVPRNGVYVCQVIYEETCYGGVINIGYNPTFDGGVLVAEVHIFDFNKDIYGKPITVNLIKYLRGEIKCSGVASLARHIANDVEKSRQILSALASERGDSS